MEIDRHLRHQLQNKEIPLGEILKEKGFISLIQLEEALEISQNREEPLGLVLLELGHINQPQLKIALQDQAAIKKIHKKRTGKKRRLGDILMAAGVLTEEQLAGALEFSVAHGVRIGEALVQLGIVTDDELAKSVGEQLMIPYIKLAKTPPDPLIMDKVPSKMAQKHMVMPVKLEDGQLFVAMVDPQNILVIDDIEMSTGLRVVPMIVSEKDFKNSYDAHYGEGAMADSLIEMIDEAEDSTLEEMASEDFDENSAPIKTLMNKVVTSAVEQGTSDIHIEPFEHQLLMRYRIDGMLRKGAGPFPSKLAGPISSRIKVMAGLEISEVRMPQDGKFRMSLKGKVVDVRVSTCPVSWGEKIVMRILDQSGSRLRLNSLGLDKENFDLLQYGLNSPNGILLVTGPTGSGKTTTLYSSLVSLNKPSVNIQTAEDPVEYDLPGIAQSACIPEIGMTFGKVLKAFLRQDPDIILIGEIRDMETAQIALKAALTGHLVLSTLHTNSAVESIGRMLNMGIDRFLITSAVRVILAQRLMRRLCESCKQIDKLSKKDLISTGINDRLMSFDAASGINLDKLTLYKSKGCKECLGNGYKGRLAIHEVMKMTENMAIAVNKGLSTVELKRIAKEDGMMSLRDSALIRAIQGVSSIEEVNRLTVNEDKLAATEGEEDLIDEILIRSGTWKLTTKELYNRKKEGKYVPGMPGQIPPFFLSEDVASMEAELDRMEASEAGIKTASVSNMVSAQSFDLSVFNEILGELKNIGNSEVMEQVSTNSYNATEILQQAVSNLKTMQTATPEGLKIKIKRLFEKLEYSLDLIKLSNEPIQVSKKKIPLQQAVVKDIYNKIPKICVNLSERLNLKIDSKSIKFSKEMNESKFLHSADWSVLKKAFILVLENHLESLTEGGVLKLKTRIFIDEKTDKEKLEFVFQDNSSSSIKSMGNDAINAGFTTHKGRLGLGLFVAKRILKQHGAFLSIQIVSGKGCQTKLIFNKE